MRYSGSTITPDDVLCIGRRVYIRLAKGGRADGWITSFDSHPHPMSFTIKVDPCFNTTGLQEIGVIVAEWEITAPDESANLTRRNGISLITWRDLKLEHIRAELSLVAGAQDTQKPHSQAAAA